MVVSHLLILHQNKVQQSAANHVKERLHLLIIPQKSDIVNMNKLTETHLLIVPQKSEIGFPQGERHAGDGLRKVETLCSLPPVLGLNHSFTAPKGCHISVQHVQVQFTAPHPGNLFCYPEALMYLKGRKGAGQ